MAATNARRRFKTHRQRLSRQVRVLVARLGLVVERTSRSTRFEALLLRRLGVVRRSGGRFCFLQIGANDGVSHDPIHAFVSSTRVPGIVVEPLPDVFETLCRVYRNHPEIRKLNVAVHNELDRVTLYRPDPAIAGDFSGITSVRHDRHALTGDRSGLTANDMIAVEVPAMSIGALLAQEQVEHLDLLQIDAEGYDMDILDSLDLARWRPSIIRFEHGVYSGVPVRDRLRDTLLRLYDHGYAIAMERVDAMAWMQEDLARRKSERSSVRETSARDR